MVGQALPRSDPLPILQVRNKEQKVLTTVSARFPTVSHALWLVLTAQEIGLGAPEAEPGALGTLLVAQGQCQVLRGHCSMLKNKV